MYGGPLSGGRSELKMQVWGSSGCRCYLKPEVGSAHPGNSRSWNVTRETGGTERGREMMLVGRLSIWTESAFSVRLRVKVVHLEERGEAVV